MRIGVFGGTFDPPHAGHLSVARAVRDALALDRVEVMPSAVPPHRRPPAASAPDRLAMIALATAGEPRLVPSPRELLRDGVSYTVDTLRALHGDDPGAELFLVIGADSYDELPLWRAAVEIQELAHLAVLPRPGSAGFDAVRDEDRARLRAPGDAPPSAGRAVFAVPMPAVPIAARVVREQLSRGEDPGAALAPAVFEYITKRGLYGWR